LETLKKIKNLAAIFVLIIAFAIGLALAATATTYNNATYFEEGEVGTNYVLYYGTVATTTSDSIGYDYTKPMYIAPFTEYNCFYYLVMSNSARGTEDCNVYVEYSFDRLTWFVGSAASGKIKDQLTTTAVSDTLNIIVGVEDTNYKIAPWMRLKFDYEAGNPALTTTTWKLRFFKNPELETKQAVIGTDRSS